MSYQGNLNGIYCYDPDGFVAIYGYASRYAPGVVAKTNGSAKMRSEYEQPKFCQPPQRKKPGLRPSPSPHLNPRPCLTGAVAAEPAFAAAGGVYQGVVAALRTEVIAGGLLVGMAVNLWVLCAAWACLVQACFVR